MKKKNFENLLGTSRRKRVVQTAGAVVGLGLILAGVVSLNSEATDPIKSQGNIHFDNSTPNDMSDDVYIHGADFDYLNNRVEEQITQVTNGKNQIAQTSAGKGSPVTAAGSVATFQELTDAVADIGTDGTAGAADVLSGKTIYNGTGYTTGSMRSYSGDPVESKDVTIEGDRGKLKIPDPGYYDASTEIIFDLDLIRNEVANLTGNAETSQVLSGKTFYNNSLDKKTGTMINHSGSTQATTVIVNGTTGTISLPSPGYYDTSSKITVDLTTYTQQVESRARISAFKRVGNVNFSMADSTAVRTVDCTHLEDWRDLTTENFFLIPTQVKVQFYNPSGDSYDFQSSLGNLNDPDKNKYSYNPNTGILSIVGNGTFGNIQNSQDVIQVWYDWIDVYVWRR